MDSISCKSLLNEWHRNRAMSIGSVFGLRAKKTPTRPKLSSTGCGGNGESKALYTMRMDRVPRRPRPNCDLKMLPSIIPWQRENSLVCLRGLTFAMFVCFVRRRCVSKVRTFYGQGDCTLERTEGVGHPHRFGRLVRHDAGPDFRSAIPE